MSNFADLARTGQFLVQPNITRRALKNRVVFGGAGVLALLLGAAILAFHARPAASSVAPPPAVPVTAERVTPRTVTPFAQFSGRISAVDYAEIRPQVAGRITEIRFHDGQRVKAGDTLFVIDPRPYEAAMAKAKSDLASAINNAKEAKLERERGERLIAQHALAREAYDQRVNADNVAEAQVGAAEAVLKEAALNVDYAYVKAPISGRISRAEITVGNLVGSITMPPPLLASIVSDAGVYADFEVDEATYLNSVRHLSGAEKVPVELQVEGDNGHVYRGTIESFDNRIDAGSGTIRARARFANEDGSLMPGMFVSVKMESSVLANALLVPERAIGNDQSKRFVFIVGTGAKAEYRPVTLGATVDGRRVVTAGLKAGDEVVVDGLQRLGPGVPVAASLQEQTASN